MPIYDITCETCGYTGEVLVLDNAARPACPGCGSSEARRLMSATSSLTGRTPQSYPGPTDTACCGSHPPDVAGCAGPGSCCGKSR